MPSLSRSLSQTVAAHHGAVTKPQLLADGLSEHSIRRLVGSGTLLTVHQHVYRMSTSPDSFEFRCAAACLADPNLVVTGIAAGRLWEFRHIPTTDLPIVLIEHFRTSLSAGVIVRRTNRLSDEDIVRRPDGIQLASPPRTWFDCSRDVDDEHFEPLTEWVLDKHSRVPTLWRTLRRLDQQGRPGLARAKKVLSQRPNWQKPAGSGLGSMQSDSTTALSSTPTGLFPRCAGRWRSITSPGTVEGLTPSTTRHAIASCAESAGAWSG